MDFTNRKSAEELSKLPNPTNKALKALFQGVDRVVIKDDGVIDNRALSDKIVLEIAQHRDIATLESYLEINEGNTGFYCMCLGTYAIELYSEKILKATIGFHHGYSVRFWQWNGDAELARSEELLRFLAAHGLQQPLQERLQQKRDQEPDRVAEKKWLSTAPKCLHKYLHNSVELNSRILQPLLGELSLEIPNKQERVIVLLQTYGLGENNWMGYPAYEELAGKILNEFDQHEIIAIYLQSDRNYKTRRGLGRLLLSATASRKENQSLHIEQEVLDDIDKCYRYFNDRTGLEKIAALNR